MSRDPQKVMTYEGLTVSVVLHGALLGAILFGSFGSARPLDIKPQEAVMVDISAVSDKSEKQAQSTAATKPVSQANARPVEPVKPVAPAPKVAPEVVTAAKEQKPPPPPPEPEKEEPKKVEEKPVDPNDMAEILKTIEEKPPVKKPPPKPEKKPEKKYTLDTDQLAQLLDKSKKETTAPLQPSKASGDPTKSEKDLQGSDSQTADTIAAALAQQIYQCMNIPQAVRGKSITISIKFRLNKDGSLDGEPQPLEPTNDPITQAYNMAAISAVQSCQNYKLPVEAYDGWRDNEMTFNSFAGQ